MKWWSYKAWWTRFGGRPWTYIIRDWWAKYELLWIIGMLAVGATLGEYYGWLTILRILAIFAVGILFGHLFWGDNDCLSAAEKHLKARWKRE